MAVPRAMPLARLRTGAESSGIFMGWTASDHIGRGEAFRNEQHGFNILVMFPLTRH